MKTPPTVLGVELWSVGPDGGAAFCWIGQTYVRISEPGWSTTLPEGKWFARIVTVLRNAGSAAEGADGRLVLLSRGYGTEAAAIVGAERALRRFADSARPVVELVHGADRIDRARHAANVRWERARQARAEQLERPAPDLAPSSLRSRSLFAPEAARRARAEERACFAEMLREDRRREAGGVFATGSDRATLGLGFVVRAECAEHDHGPELERRALRGERRVRRLRGRTYSNNLARYVFIGGARR